MQTGAESLPARHVPACPTSPSIDDDAPGGRISPHRAAGRPAGRDPFLYTLPDAAAALNRAEVTLRRWIRKGLMPFIKINGRYYIEREALTAFIQCHNHPLPHRPSD
jgi:excisionase family DNA binding protein